jgi:predicted hydrocarbon binding protein
MADPSFRPEGALQIDLARGELSGGHRRLVALPTGTLLAIARAVEATNAAVSLYGAGREWGESVARDVADRIREATGKGPRDVSPAVVVDHLAGVVASLGWGTVAIETWGDALVFVLENAPMEATEPARHLVSGFFAGIAGGLSGSAFAGAAIGSGGELRVLVGSPGAIKAARRWHESGIGLGAIVDRLRAGEHGLES